ncbi:DUF262 domain-containing protein [uncultured Litoreibacter sp.]|uniref:DUF262 domain-containing protein n=1 Tax=uncultured Litoreibacter sp. TaxID=1392394 RepID=UPI0026032229|nr:DUF262 domain-containing protein [uncultured Litoreibacter sp.]
MVEETTYDDLETVEDDDETPFVEFDISVAPSDPSLELLAAQIERKDIVIPFYQRRFVWKIQQASRLIESFLMGLPVPQVFLFENSEGVLEVIDGQQRLMSVKYYLEGYFDEPDTNGKRQVFRLRGLSERSEYNGLAFDELPSRAARRLRNSTLRAINIKQLNPKDASDSVFHIFERLNTGGTQLKPQEIRNAVFRGPIVDYLLKLNDITDWQSILGLKRPERHQKDVELVLRLASLYHRWEGYEKPLIKYLNQFMAENRELEYFDFAGFESDFARACKTVVSEIEKPFRPRGIINSAVLEAVMVTLLETRNYPVKSLQKRYNQLLDDEEFVETYSQRTTDTNVVHKRLTISRKILCDA